MGKRWDFQTPIEELVENIVCFLVREVSISSRTIEFKEGSCGSMFGDQYEGLIVSGDCGGIDWEDVRKASGLRTLRRY
jgi:hypothetical protein